MTVRLITAAELEKGAVVDHWVFKPEVLGKAVEDVTVKGSKVTVEYIDGSQEEVPRHLGVFVREPKLTAQKDIILSMFNTREGKKWRAIVGKPEIKEPHLPLSWVPLAWVEVLRELVQERRIRIVTVKDRAFIVKPEEWT